MFTLLKHLYVWGHLSLLSITCSYSGNESCILFTLTGGKVCDFA